MNVQGLSLFLLACASAWMGMAIYALRIQRHRSLVRATFWLSVCSAAWTFSLVKPPALSTGAWLALTHTTEAARLLGWWALVMALSGDRLLHEQGGLRGLRFTRRFFYLCLAGVMYTGWSPLVNWPSPAVAGTAILLIITALTPLLAMEQLFRNINQDQRWSIKFILLALIISTGADLITHFHTLLYRGINLELWLARAPAGFVAALLLAIGIRRVMRLPARIALSHDLVFHTGTLVVLGLCLIAVALGAWLIQNLGGAWSHLLLGLFLAAALAVLASAVLSGRVRGYLRVLLSRHLLPYRYDHRKEWMRLSESLTTAASDNDLPDTVVHALAHIVDSPAGLLLEVHGSRLHCLSAWNMKSPSQPLDLPDEGFNGPWILNARDDPAASLPEWFRALPRAWLGIPLLGGQGIVAVVVLAQPRSPRALNWEDYDLLKLAARQAGSIIALRQSNEALADARQFAALHQSTAFLAHDIKTMVAQLSLLTRNADHYRDNPAFINDMVETVRHSVGKMEQILKRLREPASGKASRCAPVEVTALCREVAEKLSGFSPPPTVVLPDTTIRARANREDLATAMGHLVRNAQQACRDSDEVVIRVSSSDGLVLLTVSDSGQGMSPAFIRDNLFKPFHSTRGLTGMGIGAFQSRALIEAMNGTLHVSSREGEGTCFSITLVAERAREERPDEHGKATADY